MRAVFLAITLFLATSSFAQIEVFTANVEGWAAAQDSAYYNFYDNQVCKLPVPEEDKKSLSSGRYYKDKKWGILCWNRAGDRVFLLRDDGKAVMIPYYKVHPIRRA